MSRHTLRPWRIGNRAGPGRHGHTKYRVLGPESPLGASLVIATLDGYDEITQANAAFIVKAANCHDELLAALKAIYECGSIKEAERIAGAAIAKAEGTE